MISLMAASPPKFGLNRTSVGLKPGWAGSPHPGRSPGLNRTSVGLKLGSGTAGGVGRSGPQSNQRGIETYSFPPLIKQQKCKQSLKPRRHTYENQDTSTSHLGLCIHGFSIFPFAFTTLLFALLFSVAARPVRVRLASYPQVFHRFSTAPNF